MLFPSKNIGSIRFSFGNIVGFESRGCRRLKGGNASVPMSYNVSLGSVGSTRRSGRSKAGDARFTLINVANLYSQDWRITQLAKMVIDPKVMELTADVFRRFFQNRARS